MSAAELVKPLSIALLLVMMAGVGMEVSYREVIASFREAGYMLLGMFASFVLVPIVTVLFMRAYEVQPMVAVGFLILAVCPGAPFIPTVSKIAGGNVPVSVGLMLVLAASSAILAPLLLRLLLARLPGTGSVQIDFLAILKTLLVTQLLPLGLALAFHAWKENAAARLASLLKKLSLLLLVVLMAALFVAYWDEFAKLRFSAYVGMLLLFATMFAIGWLLGGPGIARRKTMAFGTASRNAGVGLVIVAGNFANTPAVPAVTVFALVIIFAALGGAFPLSRIGNAPARNGG
jgi:BASS family bile acid:Na+ symporter